MLNSEIMKLLRVLYNIFVLLSEDEPEEKPKTRGRKAKKEPEAVEPAAKKAKGKAPAKGKGAKAAAKPEEAPKPKGRGRLISYTAIYTLIFAMMLMVICDWTCCVDNFNWAANLSC